MIEDTDWRINTQLHISTLIKEILNENGPFEKHLTLSIDADLRVYHLNIEGISKRQMQSPIQNLESLK